MAKSKPSSPAKSQSAKSVESQSTKTASTVNFIAPPIENTPRNFKILLGIIVGATLIAYLPGFQNGFVWDDMFYIVNDEDLRKVSFDNFYKLISDFYLGNWHPLTMLTYYLEYTLVKDTAWVYHLNNTIIHILNSILVFKVIEKLSKNFLVGAVTAVLFAIHPLHVESVVWAAERKDVLYTLFLLLSFRQYLKYSDALEESGKTQWNNKHLWFALVLFILSCFSKGMAVILPVVFLLTDYFLLNRRNLIQIGIEKAPFFLISLIFGLISIKAQSEAGANATKVISSSYSLGERFFMINYGMLTYWLKMLVPANMLAFYPYPQKPTGVIPSSYYSSFAGIIVIALLVYFLGRRNKLVWWGGLYFLIVIFPVSQVLPVGSALMADRYFYVSSIGPLMLIGLFANYLYQKASTNKAFPSIATIVLLAFTFLSFRQSTKWKDTLTLFTPVFEKYPSDPMVTSNLGWYWFLKKDNEKAKFYFEETHKTNFKTADVHTALGQIYFDEKKYKLTVENFEAALKLKPEEMKNLHWMLGGAYFYTGEYDKAVAESQIALDKSDNKNQFANNIMGLALCKKGDEVEGRKYYEKALSLDPKFADPYVNISTIYNHQGNHEKEIEILQKALKVDKKAMTAYKNLGVAYKTQGKWQDAIKVWEQGAQMDAKDGSFYYNIGLEYGQHGDIPNGVKAMQKAVARGDSNAISFLTVRGIPLK